MDIHDQVTITMPHWKWMWFTGWLDAEEPGDSAGDDLFREVRDEISAAVRP